MLYCEVLHLIWLLESTRNCFVFNRLLFFEIKIWFSSNMIELEFFNWFKPFCIYFDGNPVHFPVLDLKKNRRSEKWVFSHFYFTSTLMNPNSSLFSAIIRASMQWLFFIVVSEIQLKWDLLWSGFKIHILTMKTHISEFGIYITTLKTNNKFEKSNIKI